MHDPLSHYRCQIPELLRRCIRGCFHGWVILSNHPHNTMWSLWNPVTSKTIHLPPLILKDGDFESIKQCCLSSPPNDPTSILMLTRTKTPTIAFCRLDRKRKRLRWKEMAYAKQLKSIVGDHGFLRCLTWCNGKVYALVSSSRIVIQVDIMVKDKEVVISLLAFGELPSPFDNGCSTIKSFLRGYCKDLFLIKLGFDEMAKKTPGAIYLFKLDTTSMIWEEVEDLKDAIFYLDLARDCSVFYSDTIASELGGYVHILSEMGKVIYSYDAKDKIVSLSSMPCLEQSTHFSLWEFRLHGEQGEMKCGTGFKLADEIMPVRPVRDAKFDISYMMNEEPHLLNIPHDVLGMIMEYCVGVEYLNFRATCKHLQLAAPIRRLHTYSINSPWLLVIDKHRGIITFTDPMFGGKYFIKLPQKLIGDMRIYYSRDGWLLLYKLNGHGELFLFNPFTKDIRELPNVPCLDSLYFLAPPTSPNCMLVGLSASLPVNIFAYSLTWESWEPWARYPIDFDGMTPHSLLFSTLCGAHILALNQGALNLVLPNNARDAYLNTVVAEAPRGNSAQYFLVNCDRHLLLVVMQELGEFVEVLKLNDSTLEWEKIDGLGRDMIYICGTTCLCMEAKTPEMENKIYFPRLDSKYGKIVFYSLETRKYHTFNGRNIQQCFDNFIGTKYHVYPHAWIQPSWS